MPEITNYTTKRQKPSPQINSQTLALQNPTKPRHKSRVLKIILALVLLLIVFLVGAAVLRANSVLQKISVGHTWTFFGGFGQIISSLGDKKLIGEDSGQINILLLGVGGEGHEGPYLTDTMILAQIRPDLGTISLISIPRDYQVTLADNYGKQKINAAFAYGLGKEKNKDWATGGQWAREQVEKLSGLTIPYFAVVDFSGFETAINQVGGVDVTVDRTFTDAEYPNETFGYLPPQTFTAGSQHMDGKTALIFARSRHGNNEEGSDFARSKRQKKIIEAFKAKALNLNLISDSNTINKLLDVFADHFHTNLSAAEMLHLFKLSHDGKIGSIVSESLDPSTHLLCDGKDPDTGAYIIFPCSGITLADINSFFKNSFTTGKVTEEDARIWLANSTDNSSLYIAAEKQLRDAGAQVYQVGYNKDFLNKTVIYQVNPKPGTAQFIKDNLGAAEAQFPPSGMKIDSSKVDIIVVLGNSK